MNDPGPLKQSSDPDSVKVKETELQRRQDMWFTISPEFFILNLP